MKNLVLVQQLKLELIRSYEPMVWTVGGLAGASLEDAREALHDSICRMLVGLRNRPAQDRIVAWRPYIVQAAINQLRGKSRQIARRKHRVILFSELDSDGRKKLLAIPDPHPPPADKLEKDDTRAILWAEVAILSPRQAEVLKRWAHGVSFLDISLALDIMASTVRNLWSRGIRRLRTRPEIRKLAA